MRAKPGAPVSAPCTWEEIEAGAVHPQSFTLRTMRERLAGVGDLWADLRRPSSTAPIYFFGGSAEMRRASVQVMSSWSPTLSVSNTFLSFTRRL